MNAKDIQRINELYAIKKQRPLTEGERAEREQLYARYLADVRASLRGHLESIVVEQPDGSRAKLKKKDDIEH